MEYKRIVAAGLTCAMLFSMPVPALAVRKGSAGPKAAGKLDTTQIVPVTSGSLSFNQIESRVLANNPSLHAAREGLESAKSNDINKQLKDQYDEMEDALDALDLTISQLESSISAMSTVPAQDLAKANQDLHTALTYTEGGGINSDLLAQSIDKISSLTASTTAGQMMASSSSYDLMSLKAQRDSLEENLSELKGNEKKMKEEFQKTIEDLERQVENAEDQLVSAAEGLYITILSNQLSYESLQDSLLSMENTVQEMKLRYELGQISAQTLLQVQNGYATMINTASSLSNGLTTIRSNLQSLMGEVPDGNLELVTVPAVTQEQLDAIRYDSDLAKAKEASYALYSAARSVEKAEDDMDTARKDHGKNSYQYKTAEHAYQSAVYQQTASIASFELSFQTLYQAIAPAQATLSVKELDLIYQEQECAAAELKYQQGNLSANALQEAVNARESARRDVENAKLDLFSAYHAYRQAVDKGLVSSAG